MFTFIGNKLMGASKRIVMLAGEIVPAFKHIVEVVRGIPAWIELMFEKFTPQDIDGED
jgi:hypothetical protein